MRALALALCLVAWPAAAQESLFTNVAPGFRPGPYSLIRVDPNDPERFVVGTADGWVLSTHDGGVTTSEIQAILPRVYYPMVLRGAGGNRGNQFGRSLGRQAHRLFISMLRAGLATTRWAPWMALEDPQTDIFDIAMPPPGGHGALAGPYGVFVSDERMGVWHRALGMPRPKGNVLIGFAAAFDPGDPMTLFAGTSDGLFVSHDAGQTFSRHHDKKMNDESVKQILWDQKDPNNLFLLAGETIFKSENHGESFEAVLSADGEVTALAQADEGVYVASSKGLSLYGGEGTKQLLKDENVVGVVAIGNNSVLAATESALNIIDGDGKRSVMNTTASDPFIKLAGSADVAWALTKYGIFRIGVKEPRRQQRAKRGPEMLMTIEEVQRAVLKNMGIGDPAASRLHDRWYAAFLPQVQAQLIGGLNHQHNLSYDATFPISYRQASAMADGWCCGGASFNKNDPTVPVNPEPEILVKWDLAKLIPYGNVTMPWGLVESGLRGFRDKVLQEVRWRYRELRNLCSLLRYPPKDPRVRLNWQMRVEELAQYIDALTGKRVVGLENMEEVNDVQNDD